MGVCLYLGRSRFTMDPNAEAHALDALRREHGTASFAVDLEGFDTFEQLMDASGWRLRRNAAGRIRGLARALEKRTGDEERLFEAIAPHVDAGSFIEWIDDYENQAVRLEFDGRTCKVLEIDELPGEEDMLEEADRAQDLAAASLPPRWSELAVPTGELRRYRISERFERGQWLQHIKFGPGFVASASADKLTAVFEQGVKTLVHGRS